MNGKQNKGVVMGFQISLRNAQPLNFSINTANETKTNHQTTNALFLSTLNQKDDPFVNNTNHPIKAKLINQKNETPTNNANKTKEQQTTQAKAPRDEINSAGAQNHLKNTTKSDHQLEHKSITLSTPTNGLGRQQKSNSLLLKPLEKSESVKSTNAAKEVDANKKIDALKDHYALKIVDNELKHVLFSSITDPKERENLINNKQFGKIVNNKFVYPPGCPYANPGGKTVIDGKEYENQEMTQEEVDEFKQQITEHFAKLDAGEIKDEKEGKDSSVKLQQELQLQRRQRSGHVEVEPEGTEAVTKKGHSNDSSAVLDAIRDSVDESNYEKRKKEELEKMIRIQMKLLDNERLSDRQEVPPIGCRTYQNLTHP